MPIPYVNGFYVMYIGLCFLKINYFVYIFCFFAFYDVKDLQSHICDFAGLSFFLYTSFAMPFVFSFHHDAISDKTP